MPGPQESSPPVSIFWHSPFSHSQLDGCQIVHSNRTQKLHVSSVSERCWLRGDSGSWLLGVFASFSKLLLFLAQIHERTYERCLFGRRVCYAIIALSNGQAGLIHATRQRPSTKGCCCCFLCICLYSIFVVEALITRFPDLPAPLFSHGLTYVALWLVAGVLVEVPWLMALRLAAALPVGSTALTRWEIVFAWCSFGGMLIGTLTQILSSSCYVSADLCGVVVLQARGDPGCLQGRVPGCG